MPSALRVRVALIGFVAVLLVPIGTSSLRSLTHVLTCDEPFELDLPVGGEAGRSEACHGLAVELESSRRDDGRLVVVVRLSNGTDHGWRGTVEVVAGDSTAASSIGLLGPGATETDRITLASETDAGTLVIR